jgi:hypothetical protein
MLGASDELRHPADAGPNWRESLYFNFHDAKHELGGWVYLWLLPNQLKPTGMLVSFYHGAWPDVKVADRATGAPLHTLNEGDRWLYCYQQNAETLIADNFDDIRFGGLHLRRVDPLQHYRIDFDDGVGTSAALDCLFITQPYDYADGVFPTPPWMAANRYHRAWRARGTLKVNGRQFEIDCTGDSDHSWGTRDMSRFGDNLFKMWSFQSPDSRLAVSALKQGVNDQEIPLGYTWADGRMASITSVVANTRYGHAGVQGQCELIIADELKREIRAKCSGLHSLLGWGSMDSFWGFEGVGLYEIEGRGSVPGLNSYFWPSRVSPDDLIAARYE